MSSTREKSNDPIRNEIQGWELTNQSVKSRVENLKISNANELHSMIKSINLILTRIIFSRINPTQLALFPSPPPLYERIMKSHFRKLTNIR